MQRQRQRAFFLRLLRHELQHVLDDADDTDRYTSDCKDIVHFERRAHMAEEQKQSF